MSLVNRQDLLKTLKRILEFDEHASPFVSLQLDKDVPQFWRAGSTGFIQSKDFSVPTSYVSLHDFIDKLRVLDDAEVELGAAANGSLKIISSDAYGLNELHVHSVPAAQAGLKKHDTGTILNNIDTMSFSGINTRLFKCQAQPILEDGKLMLIAQGGVITWKGPDSLKNVKVYPRESLLSYISGILVDHLVLSTNGYWGARLNDLFVFVKGHQLGKQLFDANSQSGVLLGKCNAERLLYALKATSGLCKDTDKIEIDAKQASTKDNFGNVSSFALDSAGWPKFSIYGRDAKTLVNALSQSKDEEAVLFKVPQSNFPTVRFERGPWNVDVKAV